MLGIDRTACCSRCPLAHPPNPQTCTVDESLTETHIALCVLLAGVYLWHFKVILWLSVLIFSQEMTIM